VLTVPSRTGPALDTRRQAGVLTLNDAYRPAHDHAERRLTLAPRGGSEHERDNRTSTRTTRYGHKALTNNFSVSCGKRFAFPAITANPQIACSVPGCRSAGPVGIGARHNGGSRVRR
jgi:hypothetical protein